MKTLDGVLAELDDVGRRVPSRGGFWPAIPLALSPEKASDWAATIRASMPRVWTAETIKDAPECNKWWIKHNGKWYFNGNSSKIHTTEEFKQGAITEAVPILPPPSGTTEAG